MNQSENPIKVHLHGNMHINEGPESQIRLTQQIPRCVCSKSMHG